MRKHAIVLAGTLLFCGIALLVLLWVRASSGAPPSRAFYYWKTQWSASPEIVESLSKNRINRLYMRFFDVNWDEIENFPRPVSPLRF